MSFFAPSWYCNISAALFSWLKITSGKAFSAVAFFNPESRLIYLLILLLIFIFLTLPSGGRALISSLSISSFFSHHVDLSGT
jgi:hypothetical protein